MQAPLSIQFSAVRVLHNCSRLFSGFIGWRKKSNSQDGIPRLLVYDCRTIEPKSKSNGSSNDKKRWRTVLNGGQS
jgi:hypothetical protein